MPKVKVDKYTITSWDLLSGFEKDGTLKFEVDELTDFTISNSEEKTPVTGKQGRTLLNLKRNKAVTASGTNGMLVGGLLAAQVGTDIESGTYQVRHRDVLSVSSDTAMTTHKAAGTAGAEIGKLYVKSTGDELNIADYKEYTQVAEAPAKTGEFRYTPDTKTITFYADDVDDGTEILVYYDTDVEGYLTGNDSEQFSEILMCTVDVTCQDMCDNIFHGQFRFYRADFNGTFDLTGGNDPTTHSFEFDTLPDLCNGGTRLWDFVVFGEYTDAA